MTANRDAARRGPVERAAEVVPPPAGRGFRWIVVTLLALSTVALAGIAALLGLVYLQLKSSDVASLKADVAGVKSETASFHADVGKAMTALQKGLTDTATEVNSATLQLNDIALSLHKKP
ncbi:hypothetical protein [Lichenibacterium ramalinae]|uniref:Methyl-accepting chemotaxis protein n=1 Tax=Lichenibacterium ramalinae TaxID=2316527 RepID=A0A4Q2RE92_9HYPH|nr:hypothetical protein [Lichenibacterium ramalinae]RYB03657.1 hypothetical protein D3272_16050 [Lichenibacterium ramalinae]